jgi:hypothetical protein
LRLAGVTPSNLRYALIDDGLAFVIVALALVLALPREIPNH